jgi:hypothetical protein
MIIGVRSQEHSLIPTPIRSGWRLCPAGQSTFKMIGVVESPHDPSVAMDDQVTDRRIVG